MLPFDSPATGWLAAAALVAAPSIFAWPGQKPPSPRGRWVLAVIALCAPFFCPSRGLASTVITGLSVVVSSRLPDLLTRPKDESALSRLLWLMTPIVRSVPREATQRAANRRAAVRFLLRALAKRLCWEPLGWCMTALTPSETPWILKTTFLILYFVLNLTALADVALALAHLAGAETDELFDWPLLSSSPREFWSRRWNRYISRFALRHVAVPLGPRFPRPIVMLAVFLASAAFHEYFAWGSAGAATRPGTMTAFFVAQGLVVVLGERLPLPSRTPRVVRMTGTAAWMLVTAPWFFASLRPAMVEFGFPEAWLFLP